MNAKPMTNSHLLVHEFDYVQPSSLTDAIALLNHAGGSARIIAGGTHLLTLLKMERETPDTLVDISHIPGLDQISPTPTGGVILGPLVKIRLLATHPFIQQAYPALATACASFGSTQIQVMATLGGNVCNGSPASDTVPPLMAYDAQLILQGMQGTRQVPLQQFLLGPGKTDLQHDEILAGIVLPAPPPGQVSTYIKISRVSADLAKISLALTLQRAGNQIVACTIAVGSAAPTVLRIPRAESFLQGQVFTPEVLAEAGRIVGEDISPIDDIRSNAWYRRQLIAVMLQDGLNALWQLHQAEPTSNMDELRINPVQATATSSAPRYLPHGVRQKIEFTLNGSKKQMYVRANELLLNLLRDRLSLTGTKYGCGLGECSACTILVDGQPMLSCLLLAPAIHGHSVTTIEGLQDQSGILDPLQDAFIDHAAYQCGYCTPGLLMTLKGLLHENPHPAEEDIRDYLKGNRCRCTGYISIVRAVLASADSESAQGEPHAASL